MNKIYIFFYYAINNVMTWKHTKFTNIIFFGGGSQEDIYIYLYNKEYNVKLIIPFYMYINLYHFLIILH